MIENCVGKTTNYICHFDALFILESPQQLKKTELGVINIVYTELLLLYNIRELE
jgi:hypothetical protein